MPKTNEDVKLPEELLAEFNNKFTFINEFGKRIVGKQITNDYFDNEVFQYGINADDIKQFLSHVYQQGIKKGRDG